MFLISGVLMLSGSSFMLNIPNIEMYFRLTNLPEFIIYTLKESLIFMRCRLQQGRTSG